MIIGNPTFGGCAQIVTRKHQHFETQEIGRKQNNPLVAGSNPARRTNTFSETEMKYYKQLFYVGAVLQVLMLR